MDRSRLTPNFLACYDVWTDCRNYSILHWLVTGNSNAKYGAPERTIAFMGQGIPISEWLINIRGR